MDIPLDPQERKKWMMKLLQDYGREFLIFEPQDQPNVFAAPEPEYRDLRSGNLDPRELRSWRYLDLTLQFLRERYELFPDQHLVIDCPVHLMHPLKGERPEDFHRSFQLTAEGTIKFRCRRSIGCRRRHCSAKNNRSIDLYDLVALLEKKGREHARQVVSEFYEKVHGQNLGHFPKSEEPTTSDKAGSSVMRYAVPKAALEKLFAVPMKGRASGERFALKAVELVMGSSETPYDGIRSDTGDAILLSRSFDWKSILPKLGAAAKLFLWAHWRQAERAAELNVSDQEVADAMGIDRRTLQRQKQVLVNSGLLEVIRIDDTRSLWSVSYAEKC